MLLCPGEESAFHHLNPDHVQAEGGEAGDGDCGWQGSLHQPKFHAQPHLSGNQNIKYL